MKKFTNKEKLNYYVKKLNDVIDYQLQDVVDSDGYVDWETIDKRKAETDKDKHFYKMKCEFYSNLVKNEKKLENMTSLLVMENMILMIRMLKDMEKKLWNHIIMIHINLVIM